MAPIQFLVFTFMLLTCNISYANSNYQNDNSPRLTVLQEIKNKFQNCYNINDDIQRCTTLQSTSKCNYWDDKQPIQNSKGDTLKFATEMHVLGPPSVEQSENCRIMIFNYASNLSNPQDLSHIQKTDCNLSSIQTKALADLWQNMVQIGAITPDNMKYIHNRINIEKFLITNCTITDVHPSDSSEQPSASANPAQQQSQKMLEQFQQQQLQVDEEQNASSSSKN